MMADARLAPEPTNPQTEQLEQFLKVQTLGLTVAGDVLAEFKARFLAFLDKRSGSARPTYGISHSLLMLCGTGNFTVFLDGKQVHSMRRQQLRTLGFLAAEQQIMSGWVSRPGLKL